MSESVRYSVGGDAEAVPPEFAEAIVKTAADHVELKMPKGGGGYRVYAVVRDGRGGAALANVPLYVEEEKGT